MDGRGIAAALALGAQAAQLGTAFLCCPESAIPEVWKQAVRTAREFRPDAVVLDVMLPDFDGFEVLRRLRADARTAAIPVVVVSADATAASLERLRAAGADGYVTKPLDVDEFLRVVEGFLDARAPGPAADGAARPPA